MKFTLDWLKDHLETNATLDQIAERQPDADRYLEVESVEDQGKALKPFVVAKVVKRRRIRIPDKSQRVQGGPPATGDADRRGVWRSECEKRHEVGLRLPRHLDSGQEF